MRGGVCFRGGVICWGGGVCGWGSRWERFDYGKLGVGFEVGGGVEGKLNLRRLF